MFQVSVIIPVYNAVNFIEKAVESVIHQHGVGEVLLIDDAYPDGALEVCKELEKKYSNVKLLQHPNAENRGAGASRNLGIQNTRFEYIAFLDADDYYLPDRFKITEQRFNEYPEAEGVYEPVGTHYQDEEAKLTFSKWKGISLAETTNFVTYPNLEKKGREFFDGLIDGIISYPHLNGITLKRSIFEKTNLFETSLRLHQDTELLIRLAYVGYFVPGEESHVVAERVVHAENRIAKLDFLSRFQLIKTLYTWAKNENLPPRYIRNFKNRYIIVKTRHVFNSNGIFVKIIYNILLRIL